MNDEKQNFALESTEESLKILRTDKNGLDKFEVEKRRKHFGLNELAQEKDESLFVVFLRQFKDPFIYMLLAAGVVVGLLGEMTDTFTILAVLLVNAVIGSIQEGKAQNTLKALKKLVTTETTVTREGVEKSVQDIELVPGDILILREGDKVSADARLIDGNVGVSEAALTGESISVFKNNRALKDKTTIFGQNNMVFRGTNITSGYATAVVTATGLRTEIGKITKTIPLNQTEIPLQKQIEVLSKKLLWFIGIFSVLLFTIGEIRGLDTTLMFKVVVSLAVSIIPEGLPVAITLALAAGVYRMSKRNALIRKLRAIESLGQANILVCDKTGTLTRNELQVEKIFCGGKIFTVSGEGYNPKAEIRLDGEKIKNTFEPALQNSAVIAALCNKASVIYSEEERRYKVLGDPTEGALVVFGNRLGLTKQTLLPHTKILSEIPFDYKKRFRAVVVRLGNSKSILAVGASEAILPLCDLEASEKESILRKIKEFSTLGLRVLVGAYKADSELQLSNEMPKMEFCCVYGLSDSLHTEVPEMVRKLERAGVSVVMITGDNKITAETIGKKAGILKDNDLVMTGDEILELPTGKIHSLLSKIKVFARITPEHKLKIIELYRKRGDIVAMTGDGVNDAPALVDADLGVSMGITGTSVAKEASDMILLDDKLSSIVAAVEEGRNIFKTIQKVLMYLFSTNAGEALTITLTLILGLPLPLLPVQIIWLNFVTDGFMTVALGLEKKEDNLLLSKPRNKEKLIGRSEFKQIALHASVIAIGSVLVFNYFYKSDLVHAYSITLTLLSVFQWFRAWSSRDRNTSIFRANPFSNPWLISATLIVIGLQVLALYTPFFNRILKTTPISFNEWVALLLIASSIIWIEEIRKAISSKRR